MQLFILLLILLTPVGSKSEGTSHQEICKPGQCYQILEDALLSEPENLYKLQQAFFYASDWTVLPADRLPFTVCVRLTDETQHLSPDFLNFSADLEWCQGKSCTPDGRSGCWNIAWSSSLLYGAVTQQLFGLDNTLTTVLYFGSIRDSNYHYYSSIHLYVSGSLPCSRIEASSLDEAVITLATWFKAYARAHSKPGSWNNEDKGYVTRHYGYCHVEGVDSYNSLHIFRVILLVAFIILNITAQLFVVILVPRNYFRVIEVLNENGEHAVNSYWSLAIVAAVINLVLFVTSFRFLYPFEFSPVVTPACPIKSLCSNPTIYLDTNISYSFRIATIFLMLILDLLVAVWTLKYPALQPPCCCSSKVWSKVAQTLALWNILILLQFHIMSVIPASILIILAPARSIAVLATWAILFLLFMLIMANIIDTCRHNSHRSCSIVCIVRQLFVILALFWLVLIAISYLLVQVWGVGRSNVPEFVWSLISPVFLSLLGWRMKKRFFLRRRAAQD